MAWRNQQTFAGGGDGDGSGKVSIVSFIHHHRDQDGAEGGRIRSGRSGNTAEEVGCHNIHHGQTATHPANERVCQGNQFIGYPAGSHQDTHGDEERHCHQGEGPDTLYHLLRERYQILTHGKHAQNRGNADRIGDREAENNHKKEAAEQDNG